MEWNSLAPQIQNIAKLADAITRHPGVFQAGPDSTKWLTDFFTTLASLKNLIETGAATEVDAAIHRTFYQRIHQAGMRVTNKRPQAKAWGQIGGASRSSRKRASSKKNGKKGGRPNPDAKTVHAAKKLLQGLLQRDQQTKSEVTNYLAPPRHLRYLVVLMREAGLANVDLRLPHEWDVPLRSRKTLISAKQSS